MTDEYRDGATFIFNINIANDSSGASDIALIYTAGEGNEFEVLYGMIENLDSSARRAIVQIDGGVSDDDLAFLLDNNTLASTGLSSFPTGGSNAESSSHETVLNAGARLIVSGPMRLRMRLIAVALSQDVTFSGALRIRGGIPTRATSGAGTPVVTVAVERVA